MGLLVKIGLFAFPFVGAKMAKSNSFWLFVNEITALGAWNHLAHAQHGLFTSNPAWHSSEVRILQWLQPLQEVLRATKNLAEIIHKSIMNAKTLSTTEQLSHRPGTFLWETRVYLKSSLRDQGREKRSATIFPMWLAFISVKSQFAVCGRYHAGFSPSRNNNHENFHTAQEQVFVNLSGIY